MLFPGIMLRKGIIKIIPSGSGFLRETEQGFHSGSKDVYVSSNIIREFQITEGAVVEGQVREHKGRLQLTSVEKICDISPLVYKNRTRIGRLVALNPEKRFDFGSSSIQAMRLIDLFIPVGKGTRGLVVSPPRAGKTTILENFACAIHECDPDTKIIAFLVDERPEEVTHFKRRVPADVYASSSDMSPKQHVELSQLIIGYATNQLECGRDIVVLVDSLTRMGRAFNTQGSGTGRIMSGGVEAGALDIPRRFFGLARNAENGGSITIIATALVDTGSRMDQLIFEEFKGTGNSEIVLSRELADLRIFPAIDLKASGTRREELLHSEEDMRWINLMRQKLMNLNPADAIKTLNESFLKYRTNREFITSFAGRNA